MRKKFFKIYIFAREIYALPFDGDITRHGSGVLAGVGGKWRTGWLTAAEAVEEWRSDDRLRWNCCVSASPSPQFYPWPCTPPQRRRSKLDSPDRGRPRRNNCMTIPPPIRRSTGGLRALRSIKEVPKGSNATYECSPSGACVPCDYPEKVLFVVLAIRFRLFRCHWSVFRLFTADTWIQFTPR